MRPSRLPARRRFRAGEHARSGRWKVKHQAQILFSTRPIQLAVVLFVLGGLTVVFSADRGNAPPPSGSGVPVFSAPHYEVVTPSEAKTMVHDGAELYFPAGAVSTQISIGIASL